jgi:3-oxoacyl-[acyl-carrier-protein] synthase III
MDKLKEVEIVATGVYLPGNPIPFEKIEEVIGEVSEASDHIKRLIKKTKLSMKEIIGIDQCYFAVDPKTRELTESNTSMAVKAISEALQKAKLTVNNIDCILFAGPLPDYHTPPTSTLIQHELGIERCGEMEIHSNCTGISKVMQIAFDGLRLARYKTVVVCYSQLSSTYLRAQHYNPEKFSSEHLFLRWFLSDSASALILRGVDKVKSGLRLNAVENNSIGGKMAKGMWTDSGAINSHPLWGYKNGGHHLAQDYGAVNKFGPKLCVEAIGNIINNKQADTKNIELILVTSPSRTLINEAKDIALRNLDIPLDKWFSNVYRKGYSGGSSVIIGLDEIIGRQKLPVDKLLIGITVESSKWMTGGFVVEAVA